MGPVSPAGGASVDLIETPPDPADLPLPAHDRFSVEAARFLEGRVDPGRNVHPPGNPPLDVLACLEAQDALDSIVG